MCSSDLCRCDRWRPRVASAFLGSLLTVLSVSSSVAVHLYMLQFSTAASYMLIPELRDSTVWSTSYDLVLGDLVTWSDIQLHHLWSAFYIWYLDIDSDLFLGPAQMIHYVLSVQLYLYTYWIYFSTFHMMYFFTEHGYARLSMSWLSGFFHWFLAGWNLVKSSLVLAKFFLCA